MTWSQLIVSVAVVGWLLGVGALAHLLPKALAEDDFMSIAMGLEPERISVFSAIVIVSWPLSIPVMIMMKRRKEKGK
jgi:hypothetical protein